MLLVAFDIFMGTCAQDSFAFVSNSSTKDLFFFLLVCHPVIDGEARRDQHRPQEGPPCTRHRELGEGILSFFQ